MFGGGWRDGARTFKGGTVGLCGGAGEGVGAESMEQVGGESGLISRADVDPGEAPRPGLGKQEGVVGK